jgi:hypothetical protein
MISVDFHFTAKQTSENDENILRKTFYVQTNGALVETSIVTASIPPLLSAFFSKVHVIHVPLS